MELLREGSRTDQVKLLQRLLNKRRIVTPALKEDGAFGPKTRQALTTFQSQQHIGADGVAGSQTWQRLGIRHDITHSVRLFPQPTNMTCWSASATMILGNMSVGPGQAAIPGGGLDPAPQNVETFARGLGWRMHYPQTWTVGGLAALLRRKPAWAVGGGNSPGGGWLHAIVLSGLWSDGAEDASGTMIRVHDPWPPGIGSVYGRFYRGTIDGFDFISLYVLQPM
jgi:hypothetical protein